MILDKLYKINLLFSNGWKKIAGNKWVSKNQYYKCDSLDEAYQKVLKLLQEKGANGPRTKT